MCGTRKQAEPTVGAVGGPSNWVTWQALACSAPWVFFFIYKWCYSEDPQERPGVQRHDDVRATLFEGPAMSLCSLLLVDLWLHWALVLQSPLP